jgi:hypothetical protein
MTNDDADAELKRAKDSFERYLKEHPEKPDPHGLLFYLYRAEALLNDDAVRLPASISLSQEERAVLVRHLARARARLSPEARTLLIRYVTKAVGIVEKPEPLPLSDKKAVYMFVGTMYRLVPHLELLKTTLWDEMPYESAAAARAAKASKSPTPRSRNCADASVSWTQGICGRRRTPCSTPYNARVRWLSTAKLRKKWTNSGTSFPMAGRRGHALG